MCAEAAWSFVGIGLHLHVCASLCIYHNVYLIELVAGFVLLLQLQTSIPGLRLSPFPGKGDRKYPRKGGDLD